jgi:hypothetical protein
MAARLLERRLPGRAGASVPRSASIDARMSAPKVGNVTGRGPGRPPGSTNRITREMRDAVLAAAEELGRIPFSKWKEQIEVENADGMKQFYKALAVNEMRTFGIILARMMPTNITHTSVTKLPAFLTEEQVIAELKKAGLPLDLIKHMRVTDARTLSPAPGSRYRSPCHSRIQRSRIARAPARQDRPA